MPEDENKLHLPRERTSTPTRVHTLTWCGLNDIAMVFECAEAVEQATCQYCKDALRAHINRKPSAPTDDRDYKAAWRGGQVWGDFDGVDLVTIESVEGIEEGPIDSYALVTASMPDVIQLKKGGK